jgi:predicted transcriptional regulator
MLSLLICYPECKKGSTIASEIGKSHPTVSQHLTGDVGDCSHCFEKCNGEYRLAEEGVLFISEWLGESDPTD